MSIFIESLNTIRIVKGHHWWNKKGFKPYAVASLLAFLPFSLPSFLPLSSLTPLFPPRYPHSLHYPHYPSIQGSWWCVELQPDPPLPIAVATGLQNQQLWEITQQKPAWKLPPKTESYSACASPTLPLLPPLGLSRRHGRGAARRCHVVGLENGFKCDAWPVQPQWPSRLWLRSKGLLTRQGKIWYNHKFFPSHHYNQALLQYSKIKIAPLRWEWRWTLRRHGCWTRQGRPRVCPAQLTASSMWRASVMVADSVIVLLDRIEMEKHLKYQNDNHEEHI